MNYIEILKWYKETYLFSFWKWLYKQVSELFEPVFKTHKHFNIFGKMIWIVMSMFLCMIYSMSPMVIGVVFTFMWLVYKLIIIPLIWLLSKIFLNKNFKLN